MTGRCEAWRYSFLEEAAEESRTASRKYWAKGGPADRKYPPHEDADRAWPLRGRSSIAPTKSNKAWITRRERE